MTVQVCIDGSGDLGSTCIAVEWGTDSWLLKTPTQAKQMPQLQWLCECVTTSVTNQSKETISILMKKYPTQKKGKNIQHMNKKTHL